MQKTVTFLFLLTSLVFQAGIVKAAPISFTIVQSGWTGGGVMQGTFSGEDLNHDNHLILADGEITAYSVQFSGNSVIPAFTHPMSALAYFNFTLGSAGFPPSFPLFSDNGSWFWDGDDQVIGDSGFRGTYLTTTQTALVTAVPEPAAAGLSGLALALAYCITRRTAKQR